MNQVEGILLLAGIPLGLLLTGYWVVAYLDQTELTLRLSLGLLAGLASLLLTVSIVNSLLPLSTFAACLCLSPAVLTLLGRRSRAMLASDLRALPGHPGFWAGGLVVFLFIGCLLWPLLRHPSLVFYDGTSNHDSFFWVGAAEYLLRHSYMEVPEFNPLQPLTGAAQAVVGLNPTWGRMGSEGLLALFSALMGRSPIELYLYVTAALFLPWLAGVHLVTRLFYSENLSRAAKIALVGLHPLFIFFYSNSNLPNLLGALMGALAVVATELALRARRRAATVAWAGLLALTLHGLYCAYPEMVPFVYLPCGLLWLRAWLPRAERVPGKSKWLVVAGVLVSLLLNPVTTWRAGEGFHISFLAARANLAWPNRLEPLHPAQYVPTLGTLAPPAVISLGVGLSGLVALLILGGAVLAWRRARDRWGALLAASGGIFLLLYTIAQHVGYGWQKSVQFSGVFVAALMSGVLIDAYQSHLARGRLPRVLARMGAVALFAFMVFSVAMLDREIYKWSASKAMTRDWFALRDLSHTRLHGQPVLVESASFGLPFYYSMWSAYFLPESDLYMGARGDKGGGYLRDQIVREGAATVPAPAAYLTSRAWADTLDANSPKTLTGREFALLLKCNRVYVMQGFHPLTGVPDLASAVLKFEILPHSASQLVIELSPRAPGDRLAGAWRVTRHAALAGDFSAVVSGRPPWLIRVPMVAGQSNQLKLSFDGPTSDALPFVVGQLHIDDSP